MRSWGVHTVAAGCYSDDANTTRKKANLSWPAKLMMLVACVVHGAEAAAGGAEVDEALL